jgi:AcrR family transcriptional regulator
MVMSPSRERLVQAAQELFLTQGVSHTTTRQIAQRAEVNEVTLFRNFGNKYGLLLAVIQAVPTFRDLGEALMQQALPAGDKHQALKTYASECLHALEQAPAFLRSLIGEADQYPAENRQALGQRLDEASQYVAQYLGQTMPSSQFPPERLAGFLGALLIGYVVIESTSDDHHLWKNREDFLTGLVNVLLAGAVVTESPEAGGRSSCPAPPPVQDLPEPWVHQILQQARAIGPQDYALAYALFGAGLEPWEVVGLTRSHHLSDRSQHTLQVGPRQVPVNQWILGKRYGSYTSNPLTKWLKSRKDDSPWIFINDQGGNDQNNNDQGSPLTGDDVQQRWHTWIQDLPFAPLPGLHQAKQTWCVEMLSRGMAVENLSILSGWDTADLEPYVQRAQAKAALQEARALDQK